MTTPLSITDRYIAKGNGKIPRPPQPWRKTAPKERVRYKMARAKYIALHDPERRKQANRVKRLRRIMGMSHTEFAKLFGVRRRQINRWEFGSHAPDKYTHRKRILELEKMVAKVTGRAKRDGRTPNFKGLISAIRDRAKELETFGY